MNRINHVRNFIESSEMPFKMCYDLDYKSLEFYLVSTDVDETMSYLIDRKDSEPIMWSEENLILNMIKDVKDVGTLNVDTRLPSNAVLMSREAVIGYIA